MLQITIPSIELWDERTQEFKYLDERTLQLEHSLVSISKWESKWCKPFLSKDGLTREETIDYIRCMTLTQNVDPDVYYRITNDIIRKVNSYIDQPMTATWFPKDKRGGSNGEVTTNEIIYYWMVSLNIPFDPCQKWHLNRLLTLIRVCENKNKPGRKMSGKDIRSQNAAINAARRKRLNTKG